MVIYFTPYHLAGDVVYLISFARAVGGPIGLRVSHAAVPVDSSGAFTPTRRTWDTPASGGSYRRHSDDNRGAGFAAGAVRGRCRHHRVLDLFGIDFLAFVVRPD